MSKRVIVVDDSPAVRLQVGETLSVAGFEVVEAVDGQDGAEKVEADAEIAMVLCDVNMPRMSGIELLHRLKAQPRFAALPVIMLTTEGQPTLIEAAKRAGARGWVVKPFKPEILVAAVRKLTA